MLSKWPKDTGTLVVTSDRMLMFEFHDVQRGPVHVVLKQARGYVRPKRKKLEGPFFLFFFFQMAA